MGTTPYITVIIIANVYLSTKFATSFFKFYLKQSIYIIPFPLDLTFCP